MILAIDVGNTNIVIGVIEGEGKIGSVIRLATNIQKTEYEYAAQIKVIFEVEHVDVTKIDGAIISSVVPPLTRNLRQAVHFLTGRNPLIVGAGIKTGLDIGLDDPGTIGPDLVATAVAVKNYYPLPCVIVDMGTATTITCVNAAGRYIGGSIMPGATVALNALYEEASLLPSIEIMPPRKTIATNTIDCMKSGIVYGSAGAVDGILDRFQEELGDDVTIVATGGISNMICPYCRHKIKFDKYLLLKGLYLIWEKNNSAGVGKKAGKHRKG